MRATEPLDAYFQALAEGNATAALEVVTQLLDDFVSPRRVILDVLAKAQERVGDMWFVGDWSVADEHAASAVTDQALTGLSLHPRGGPAAVNNVKVVLACAEGEWHALPAKLAAELARFEDIDIRFLGASVPAHDLGRYLLEQRADVLALSVTMGTNLLNAYRSIVTAHEIGIPVVVGGRAWGANGLRSIALGADGWDEGPGVAALIRSTARGPSIAQLPELLTEVWRLDAVEDDLLRAAMRRHAHDSLAMAGLSEHQRTQVKDDLRSLARHAAAAVACNDHSLLADQVAWLGELWTARGVARQLLTDGLLHLADAVEFIAPIGAGALRLAASPTAAA